MSMTDVLPTPADRPCSSRSAYTWEAAKTVFAVLTFAALILPIAYPSKAGVQAKITQMAVIDPPQLTGKIQVQQAQAAKVSPVTPAKSTTPQLPAKKPVPKNS